MIHVLLMSDLGHSGHIVYDLDYTVGYSIEYRAGDNTIKNTTNWYYKVQKLIPVVHPVSDVAAPSSPNRAHHEWMRHLLL